MIDKAEGAVRRFCLECQGDNAQAIAACADAACRLFAFRPYRPDTSGPSCGPGPKQTAARAVRRFCMSCAGNRLEVRACGEKGHCPLWSFRFGVSPATFKRVLARRRKSRGLLFLPVA